MNVYPIMLRVSGRRAVVVGGGHVGLRKVRGLLAAGAVVRLIARTIADDADLAGVDVLRTSYSPELLGEQPALVFACTNDRALNTRIATDARQAGALVNCADQPDDCDFFAPAVVADGEVIVAVGTGGTAPALTAQLKRRLADALPERIGQFAAALAATRDRLRADVPDVHRRGEIMARLAGRDGYSAFSHKGDAGVAKLLANLMKED